MMNKIMNSKWSVRTLAFVAALLLFAYVKGVDIGKNTIDTGSIVSYKSKATMSDIPIQVLKDKDKDYFISGIPQFVSVYIEGPRNIVQTTENLQDFKISADLRGLAPGEHVVKLKQTGISDEVAVSIIPDTVTVSIEEKETKSFPVEVEFNPSLIAPGYVSAEPVLDYDEVEISGSKSTIDKIAYVKVSVSPENGLKKDYNEEVSVQVLDADYNKLDVTVNPEVVQVKIPIHALTKTVPITFKQTGTPKKGKNYQLSSPITTITVAGTQEALAKLSTVAVAVDISDIEQTTVRDVTVNLPEDVFLYSPEKVTVAINVTGTVEEKPAKTEEDKKDESSSSSESSSSESEAESSKDSSVSMNGQSTKSIVQSGMRSVKLKNYQRLAKDSLAQFVAFSRQK
ncbi:CdaR family protein [Isobaculum melis]|uniref:YbbR domain-containing protein n=1 Tax=Isobaculum melis TaxID=142588 RepID=A0A1H9TFH1_9LACT|nr:CdaR family protein [Isobaculum melis]SER95858.1 YbbR domain-containing protein [Isobaculum melis]